MAYITVQQFIERNFEIGARPSERTIIRLIQEGVLPGRKLGKYYVDADAYEKMSRNPLVNSVLQGKDMPLKNKRRNKNK